MARSTLRRALLAACTLSAFLPAAAPALINTGHGPIGPIGGGGGVFEPWDPTDPGGGGGPISYTSAELEARGYVCRPYFDGILNGKLCAITYIEPTAFEATLEVQHCNPNDRCSIRATKISRGKVGDNLSLWSLAFPGAPKAAGYGDVDGDGDDDVVAFSDITAQVGMVRVGRSNGNHSFSLPQLWAQGFCGAQTQECAVGDFDADHKADVASIDSATGQVSVLTSNGSAFVSPRVWSSTFGALNGRLVIADFDGDGAKDLAKVLAANQAAGTRGSVIVALSRSGPPVLTQGSATTTSPMTSTTLELTAAPVTTTSFARRGATLAAADLSEAELPTATVTTRGGIARRGATLAAADLSVAELPTATVTTRGGIAGGIRLPGGGHVLTGGPRIFAAPVLWTSGLCPDPHECVAGDFDGDGKDDIALVRATGEAYVGRSTGSAFLASENWSDRVGRNPRSFRAADLNADGKDDLAALQQDGSVTVGISDGSFFIANVEVEDLTCGDPLYACQFANLNGDAHLELVEIYPYGDSRLRPGDTFVSQGVEPRGFPVEPAHPPQPDGDGDGIRDAADACIFVANPGQADADDDGVGDACELRADIDNDGDVDQADRDFVTARLGTMNARADVNKDGIVNAADLAIVEAEAALPAPSTTVGEPRIELIAPRNGTFYEPWTRDVYVAGFVRNAAEENASLVVHSQTWQGDPVEVALPIGADGWFEAFVPVDPQVELNPIVALVTRDNGNRTGAARAVAQLGRSAAPGDYSKSSLGARVQSWQLAELAEEARKAVVLDKIEEEAEGGNVRNVEITPPLSLAIRTFSDQVTIDLGFPAMHIDYEDFLTGCNVPLSIGGIKAHLVLDLEARYLYPSQVAAKDLPGSPKVTFDSFHSGEHFGCTILATISDTDMKAKAIQAFELALASDDWHSGPVDEKLEDKINAIDLSQALADLDVVLGTRFRSVPEDVAGVTFTMDSGFAPTAMCGSVLCHPEITNATPRAFQTHAAHPPFPLWMPEGGLYDVALALAPDTINQLFGAMMAGGKLGELMAGRTLDLAEFEIPLFLVKLKPEMKLVPTLAPFLTGRPVEGGTEVQIGQLLLEIPSLDGTDSFRAAVDLKGTASFAIVADEPLLPIIWDDPNPPPTILQIRVDGLEVLNAQVVHIPKTTVPAFEQTFLENFLPEISVQTLSVEYPLPEFGDLGLTLTGLDAKPDGGAVVFGNLEPPGSANPGNGPVLGGGVLSLP